MPGAEIPSVVPQVASVFPHGARRGTEVTVELRGSYLDGPAELRFLKSGSLTATVESAAFHLVRARIRAAADAEAGRHDLRLVTPRGVWLGFFWVGNEIDEATETEPNDSLNRAQPIPIPAVIHGRADGADGDYFRFRAAAGQTIVFDVLATRLGSALDPVLTLLDAATGREIASNDDAYPFKDARMVRTFDREGEYMIVVSASFERSARDAEYRLTATPGPFVTSVLPLGGRRGSTVDVVLRGANLNKVRRIWLDRAGGSAKILSSTPTELRARMAIPAGAELGTHHVHMDGGGPPVAFEVGDLAEVVLTGGNGLSAVNAPVVVNGEIPAETVRLRRLQEIALDVKGGERLEFAVDSWKLGVVMDPVISLFDPSGRMVAQQDDPAPNSFIHHPATHDPRMVYAFPSAGRYRVQIHDAAYQAGGGYRLRIQSVEPGFEAEVRSPQLAAIAGRTTRLLTVIRRTGGVARVEAFRKSDSEIEHFRLVETDGWNTPIRVSIVGLPSGISAEEVTAEPINTSFKGNDGEELFVDGTVVEIPVQVSESAKAGLYPVMVHANGEYKGRRIKRQARVLHGAPRAMRHVPTADQVLWLNVIQAPPILWNVPGEISLSRGEPGRLKVGLVRLNGDYPVSVSAKKSPGGWALGSARAGKGTEEVELPVSANEEARGAASAELVLLATFDQAGRQESVESPPIQLRVRQ